MYYIIAVILPFFLLHILSCHWIFFRKIICAGWLIIYGLVTLFSYVLLLFTTFHHLTKIVFSIIRNKLSEYLIISIEKISNISTIGLEDVTILRRLIEWISFRYSNTELCILFRFNSASITACFYTLLSMEAAMKRVETA